MYRNLFSLNGKTVIITGGAGHLGTEISRGLASFGAQVTVLGRDSAKFVKFANDTSSSNGGAIECIACDVTDISQFQRVVETVYERTGRIDVLINNAAGGKSVSLDQIDQPAWLAGLDGSLNHYFSCSLAVSKHMIAAGSGVIINNASIWSVLAPNKEMYLDLNNEPSLFVTAAKGAIVQMTKHLATFWARHNIRVNAISPGWFPEAAWRGPARLHA